MTNAFVNGLDNEFNYTHTLNGGAAYKSTMNKILDLFSFGGAYRYRSAEDKIVLFKEAYEQDNTYALKCLFYLRDVRGGQGERQFFRDCYHWLASYDSATAARNIALIPYYGRFDDLYCLVDTPLENTAFEYLYFCTQKAINDLKTKTASDEILVFKWLKSENCSSKTSKALAKKTRNAFHMTSKQYRKLLSWGREQIKVLEVLMSENRWDEIRFDKISSQAGLKYSGCFATREETRDRYKNFFADDKVPKVNAGALYPYEIVQKALSHYYSQDDVEQKGIEAYWNNLPDVLADSEYNMLCVCDTSGSMTGTPINVAIGLSMYCAERTKGVFHNKYISFSSRPQLINITGVNFCDKVYRIYETNLCDTTNLEAVFDMLLDVAIKNHVKQSDLPDSICVISDMEIDAATNSRWGWGNDGDWDGWTKDNSSIMMGDMRIKWAAAGYRLPKLVYWNVNATTNVILDNGPDVSFVSGASPSIFTGIATGKSGVGLMFEVLDSGRYAAIG